jgi:hypothetical protein
MAEAHDNRPFAAAAQSRLRMPGRRYDCARCGKPRRLRSPRRPDVARDVTPTFAASSARRVPCAVAADRVGEEKRSGIEQDHGQAGCTTAFAAAL